MNGFDLRIRVDAEAGVATAEVLLADGTRDVFHTTSIDGSFNGFMAFFMDAVGCQRSNWLDAMRAWSSAWPDAAAKEGIAMLDELAKGL
jgi:hypothetical protein